MDIAINRVTVCGQRSATKRDHLAGRSVAGRSIKRSSRLITSKPLWRISSSAIEAAIWYAASGFHGTPRSTTEIHDRGQRVVHLSEVRETYGPIWLEAA
jgi:hypothetical protein